jgi:DNA-binding YbaB/EbfC family protein
MELMKQFQERWNEVKDRLSVKTVEGSSGGGMVTVEMNGLLEVVSVKIDPSIFEIGDVEMLEDLMTAAVNEAVRKVKDIITREAIDMVKPEFPGMFLA